MIPLERLRDALSIIRTMMLESKDSSRSDSSTSSLTPADVHARCHEAYLLSRRVGFHHISLLVARSHQAMRSTEEKESEPSTASRECIRSVDTQLIDAIREVGEKASIRSLAEREGLAAQVCRDGDLFHQKHTTFQEEMLRDLICWELSTDCDAQVNIYASDELSFSYEPIPIASILARLILVVGSSKQNVFDVRIEGRGLSVIFEMPLSKSSIVEVLLDPYSQIFFLGRLAESSGISLVIDERGIRLVVPLQMPDRSSLNVDYGALSTIIDTPCDSYCYVSE